MFNKKPLADTTARRPSTGAQAKIYSRDNVARYSERARQRRRSHTIRHVALIVVLGVLLSATTAAGLWFATIMGKLGDSNVITDNLRRVLVDTDEAKDPFYVLLLGTDGRRARIRIVPTRLSWHASTPRKSRRRSFPFRATPRSSTRARP